MSRLRTALIELGLIERTPRGPSLPPVVYLTLGLVCVVIGVGLLVLGPVAVGVVFIALGLINLGLSRLRRDARRPD